MKFHSHPGSRFGPRSDGVAHTLIASSLEIIARKRWKLSSSKVPRRAHPRSAASAPRSVSFLASVEASSSSFASEELSLSLYCGVTLAHHANLGCSSTSDRCRAIPSVLMGSFKAQGPS